MLLRGAAQAGNEQLSRNGQQPWLDYVVCGGDAALVDGAGTEEESLDAKSGAVSRSLSLLIQNQKLQNLQKCKRERSAREREVQESQKCKRDKSARELEWGDAAQSLPWW